MWWLSGRRGLAEISNNQNCMWPTGAVNIEDKPVNVTLEIMPCNVLIALVNWDFYDTDSRMFASFNKCSKITICLKMCSQDIIDP